MKSDSELNDWRTEWMAQAAASEKSPADLRVVAVKQQRRLRTGHVVEFVTALAFLLFSAAVAWRNPALETYLWAATVWATTLVVTAFFARNWSILWRANVESVTQYALEYQKRCIAGLKAVRFGMRFLAVQNAIAVPWLASGYLRHRLTGVRFAELIAILFCLSVGFSLLFTRYRRVALLELEELGTSQVLPTE
jgi:hypothetical protein